MKKRYIWIKSNYWIKNQFKTAKHLYNKIYLFLNENNTVNYQYIYVDLSVDKNNIICLDNTHM